jgi:hypothetical protein
MTKIRQAAIATMLALATLSLHAQTSTPAKAKTTKARPETAEQRAIRELQEKMAAQQAQIDALTRQLADKNAALAETQSAAATAQTQAAAATTQAQTAAAAAQSAAAATQTQATAVTSLTTTVTDLQNANVGLATTISATKTELNDKIDAPASIRYKGVTITPVAFFAFEGVWRQRSINSDINTPFNTTPFQGANEAHVSELNFSGRQSRLGGLFEGNTGPFKLSGYFEADFLGAGTTSNGNQSNSFVLRQRQIWGQAAMKTGFTVTGGQMWSLVTEDGKSTDNRTEKLPNAIDAQYTVGFSWARQPAIRVQQKITSEDGSKAFTVAASLEQPQITNASATVNAPTNVFFNGPGQNGGLFNAFNGTPTNNVAPDIILKSALDLAHAHFELGGLARWMRSRYYPGTSVPGTGYVGIVGAGPANNSKFAGGIFGSARVSVDKYIDLAFQVMAGDGVGRYGSAELADATFHPNGTLEPIHNTHGLFSLETHPTPKLDVYAYAGAEYDQRTVYATGVAATPFTGYAPINSPLSGCNTEVPSATGSVTPAANCSAATKNIFEAMGGFTYRIYSSPKFGRLQYQFNYQYLTRNTWTGLTGGTYGTASATFGRAKATNNMIFWGMRYYIP